MENNTELQKTETELLWKKIGLSDHIVQIDKDAIFLDALTEFVAGGFNANEPVITIAIKAHREALHERLESLGFDISYMVSQEKYFPLNAEETLAKFMVNNWPDEALYNDTIGTLIRRAHKNSHRIRAYDEMLALLWTQGNHVATMQLETLWSRFCEKASFCFFCAYPKNGFAADVNTGIGHMGCADSKAAHDQTRPLTELQYNTIEPETTNNKN